MIASVVFILGCLCYAGYSYFQIKGTATWGWHVAQWISAFLFVLSGVLFGVRLYDMGWHKFGEIIGIAALGIPVYVFFLHYLLRSKR